MRARSCPFLTRSPSSTASWSRSPERFEETFTVVAAWSFPAATTLRVMGLRFAVAIWTGTGGSGLGLSESATSAATASTKAMAMMRRGHDMVGFRRGAGAGAAGCASGGGSLGKVAGRAGSIGLSRVMRGALERTSHGAVEIGARDDVVDARLDQRELRLRELEARVAHLELRGGAGVEALLRERHALLGVGEVLGGDGGGAGERDDARAGAGDLVRDLLLRL